MADFIGSVIKSEHPNKTTHMAQPKNIEELREHLLSAFEWVKTDPRRSNQVKEMSNAAGKVLASVKLQMEYAFLKGEEPDIPFLGKTSGRLLKPGTKMLTA
jgi:hypothetical protein